MTYYIIDTEADNLLDTATKFHCLCYQKYSDFKLLEKGSFTSSSDIIQFLSTCKNYIICHGIINFDKPLLKKLLDYDMKNLVVDTLALSYAMFPLRNLHGLESWGKTFNLPKVPINDWKNLSTEKYVERCTRDVEINAKMFILALSTLYKLYSNKEQIKEYFGYLNFKMECLKEQREIGIYIDKTKCVQNKEKLTRIFDDKTKNLSDIMPIEIGNTIKEKPIKFFKKNGEISKKGLDWLEYLKENRLPLTTLIHREKPNPGSTAQLKKWLFSLGWKPDLYEISPATGKNLPKISLPFGRGLTQSVKNLYSTEPGLESLDSYYKIRHRIGKLAAFLKYEKDGKIFDSAHSFTNTLRLNHSSPCENLPKPTVFYGKEIREVMSVPNDKYIMCGADVSALEDKTKQNLIFEYDPEYVKEMCVPGFDAHIDIGKRAGMINNEEERFYNKIKEQSEAAMRNRKIAKDYIEVTEEEQKGFEFISKKRYKAKTTNFSVTYGAAPLKIAEISGSTLEEASLLYKIYWERNWSVKVVTKKTQVKTVNRQNWIYNPISGFWIFLKCEKDIFSTLNQNLGVYIFDMWLMRVRKNLKHLGIKICFQYHDELLAWFKKGYENEFETIVKHSMEEVNNMLELPSRISISMNFGSNYAKVH